MSRRTITRNVRKNLSRILGAHDWASQSPGQRQIRARAHALRKELRTREATVIDSYGFYIFMRLHEESYARKLFRMTRC